MAAQRVDIVEVGPRDGLQNEDRVLSVPERVELIDRAISAGIRRIEAVSFVNPRRVPQMAGAEEVMAEVRRLPGVSYIGLVLNRKGLDRALRAGVDEVNIAIPATDEFCRRNQGCTVEEMLAAYDDIARAAAADGMPVSVTVSTAFGCPFEGETEPERVVEIARRAADAGAVEIALADTIGVGVPRQVAELVRKVGGIAGGAGLRCHFHNTRNTGYANALAAHEHGVTVLDASVGGFGGCPFAPAATGNIATEDLLYMLHRSGVQTGIDLDAVSQTGTWLGTRLDKDLRPSWAARERSRDEHPAAARGAPETGPGASRPSLATLRGVFHCYSGGPWSPRWRRGETTPLAPGAARSPASAGRSVAIRPREHHLATAASTKHLFVTGGVAPVSGRV